MLAKIYSAALIGIDSTLIEVEVDVASFSMPYFGIVGLPDKAVEEAKERVKSAIKNSGATFPVKRIIVNLAPADLPKEGPAYDLPIAVGILIASGQLQADLSYSLILGELSLDGSLRGIRGAVPYTFLAQEKGFKKIYLPAQNAREASLITGIEIYPTSCLNDLYLHLTNQKKIEVQPPLNYEQYSNLNGEFEFDLEEIKGQEQAKRALEIAAAGGHNLALKGPPGAGKTLLARSLPSILPKLSLKEALDISKIYSTAGLLPKDKPLILSRPFRSPHHTISHVGLIGGGSNPKPGEISLAHRGVLFLDEFPEFPRAVLESLRQPLEDGVVTVSRAKASCFFPSRFMLVTAANPCPCGYLGDTKKACQCLPSQITRYQKRISGPILDRIDLQVEVPAVKVEKLTSENEKIESSSEVRARVENARERQRKRFNGGVIMSNAEMHLKEIKAYCQIEKEGLLILKEAFTNLGLSARSYFKILKVSQTIADLENQEKISAAYIAEALQYRFRDHS